jgi:hypothetical protein
MRAETADAVMGVLLPSVRGSARPLPNRPARPGERVPAEVRAGRQMEMGHGFWPVFSDIYADTETYEAFQDEDDTSKLIRLPWTHVMRLSTGAEGCFKIHGMYGHLPRNNILLPFQGVEGTSLETQRNNTHDSRSHCQI